MSGTVSVDCGYLIFELHGVDEILAIKRTITIPLEHVVSVSTVRVPWKPLRHLRVAGAAIPGIVKDGRYLTPEGYMFFEMHNPDRCVTVTLDHEKYRKIVFEVEDKVAIARMIRDAIGAR